MSAVSRLQTALIDGALVLPDGDVAVVRPDTTFDVNAVAAHKPTIVTTLYPDAARWTASGFDVTQAMPTAQSIVVNIPRSKAYARSLVAEAANKAQIIVVDGSKTDGIDSIYKACRKILGDLPSVTKAHGRIFWFSKTDALNDWIIDAPVQGSHGFYTTAGVFSDGAIDKGSALLVDALPSKLPSRVADLGAGWGYLSQAILKTDGVAGLDLIEAEHLSLDCAKLNVTDPRASFLWDDATTLQRTDPYDAVVMNPPFHSGREGDTGLGQSFIRSAARILKPNGTLWMVANRHLPYEETLSDCFQMVTPLEGRQGFKLFKASRPKR